LSKVRVNAEILRKLTYDAASGCLYWKTVDAQNRGDLVYNSQCAGKIAGGLHKATGYLHVQVLGKKIKCHRLAWFLYYGVWPQNELDHINHNRADNSLCNLRCVTSQENSQNRSLRRDNRSGRVGVYYYKRNKKWLASIGCGDGVRQNLGYFSSQQEAINAREIAERFLGYHRNHGSSL
jgi:hypothetical protein